LKDRFSSLRPHYLPTALLLLRLALLPASALLLLLRITIRQPVHLTHKPAVSKHRWHATSFDIWLEI
jgi:hypothetical protein